MTSLLCNSVRSTATTAVMIVATAVVTEAATIQIDGPPGGGNDWDETQATQTGDIGGVEFEATISALHWHTIFQDDNAPYASSFFGPLAQPTSSGDFMLFAAAPSFDVFTITITLKDTLVDPIFYVHDVDWVDAEIGFEAGADQTFGTHGAFANNTFTSDGTAPGGAFAVRYAGAFAANSTFEFSIDYSNSTNIGSELVGMGIGTLEVIPVPAAVWLFGSALCLLGWMRRITAQPE